MMRKFIDVEATAQKIYNKYGTHPVYYLDDRTKEGKEARTDCIILEMIYDKKRMVYADIEKIIKWISCSERLPDDDAEVLVFTYEEVIYIAERHIGGTWQTRDNFLYDDEEILAWLPLPEPYEGETNAKG